MKGLTAKMLFTDYRYRRRAKKSFSVAIKETAERFRMTEEELIERLISYEDRLYGSR